MIGLGIMMALGTGLVGGLINGFANSEEARRQQEAIDRQKEQATQQYNQYIKELEFSFNDTMNSLDKNYSANRTQLMNTWDARSMQSSFASTSAVKQSEAQYKELALALASKEQTIGSAIQSQALTGFRDTGSNQVAQREAERITSANIELMSDRIRLSQAELFQQASSNYFSQSVMMDSIRTNMDNIISQRKTEKDRYSMTKKHLEDRYNLQIKHLNAERDDYDYGALEWGLDIGAGILQGIGNAVSQYWE